MATVLIVDDEAFTRRLLLKIIEGAGHVAQIANSPAQAWKQLVQHAQADLVLAEFGPIGDETYRLIESIREHRLLCEVPIAVCSRETRRARVEAAMRLGIQNYLVKPCRPEQVIAEVLKAERQPWRSRFFEDVASVCKRLDLFRDDYPKLLSETREAVIRTALNVDGPERPGECDARQALLDRLRATAGRIGFERLRDLSLDLECALRERRMEALNCHLEELRLAGKLIEERMRNLPFRLIETAPGDESAREDPVGTETLIIALDDTADEGNGSPDGRASPEVDTDDDTPRATAEPALGAASQHEPFRRKLAEIAKGEAFPVFGHIASAFRQAIERGGMDVTALTRWIERDAGLSAHVLSLANRAYIAPREPVEDVATAVHLLGVERVQVTAISLTELAEANRLFKAFDWQPFWAHQVATAMLCDSILYVLDQSLLNAYLAGLLHDVGKILLSHAYPTEYRKAIADSMSSHVPLAEAEAARIGISHTEAGAIWAEKARLPDCFPHIMRYYTQPAAAPRHRQLAALVNVADILARKHGIGFSGAVWRAGEDSLRHEPGWQILREWAEPMFGQERFERQMEREVARVRYETNTLLAELSGPAEDTVSPRKRRGLRALLGRRSQ